MKVQILVFVVTVASLAIAKSDCLPKRNRKGDADRELVSWNRLKRDAGYYSESGVWQGGLWRRAKTTRTETYTCLSNTTEYCDSWSLREPASETLDRSNCSCSRSEGSYCAEWGCLSTVLTIYPHTSFRLNCSCDKPSSNGNYCAAWRCVDAEDAAGRAAHLCIDEAPNGQYCNGWRWNVSSSTVVNSAICRCDSLDTELCRRWTCRERRLPRCRVYRRSWCQLELAVYGAGGMGFFFFMMAVPAYIFGSNAVTVSLLMVPLCPLVFAAGLGLLFAVLGDEILDDYVHGPCAFTLRTLWFFLITGCATWPWIAAVVVWGGIPALECVLSFWITLHIASIILCYIHQTLEAMQHTKHPPSSTTHPTLRTPPV